MKIPFNSITFDDFKFEICYNDLKFGGFFKRKDHQIVICTGRITGHLSHYCDRCGKSLLLNLDENISLYVSCGVYKDLDNKISDTIEFFDGFIDICEILNSEVEAYKSDYFYCDECKFLEGEKHGST